MEETEFYKDGNVSITNARFMVDSTTYAMNGVTSVKRGQTNPSKVWPVIMAIIGVGVVFAAAALMAKAICVVIVLLAIAWFKAIKPDYILFLNSSSGESQPLSITEKHYIHVEINSLNNAIIHRG